MEITIFSTMSGKQWEGTTPAEADVRNLQDIFRFFNRVEPEDSFRLENLGYDLPSLSAGDFVQADGQWFLCASVGWVPVTQRQALIPQLDFLNALTVARDNGTHIDEVRPPMFFKAHEDRSITYMTPAGWWKRVPQDGPTQRLDEAPGF